MDFKLIKTELSYKDLVVEALVFIPENMDKCEKLAIFTHGYTDHKGSLFTWGSRLAGDGMGVVIFDLPGHFLGSFNDITSFESFTENTHHLFFEAYKAFTKESSFTLNKVILGGHSLGALMSLRAAELPEFSEFEMKIIPVGFGMGAKSGVHVLEGPMFEATMNARAKIISKHLHFSVLFPWLKREKELVPTSNKEIYLICGQNDGIIEIDGVERIADILKSNGNDVTIKMPKRLYHHQPELASPHVLMACR